MWLTRAIKPPNHVEMAKFKSLLSNTRNLSSRMANKSNDPNCKKNSQSLCDKTETSCKMPLLEIDENHENAQRYFRKIGKMPKRDIWIPLDYIHRMDDDKPPRVYEKTWKDCPRVVVKKAICTAEEIICPKDPRLPARFAKDVESIDEDPNTVVGRGMCNDDEVRK